MCTPTKHTRLKYIDGCISWVATREKCLVFSFRNYVRWSRDVGRVVTWRCVGCVRARLANTTAKRRRLRKFKTLGYQFAMFDVHIYTSIWYVYIIDNINFTSIIELMDLAPYSVPLFTHGPAGNSTGRCKNYYGFARWFFAARTGHGTRDQSFGYFREIHDATSNATVSDSTVSRYEITKTILVHAYKRRTVLRAYFTPYTMTVRAVRLDV